MQKLTTFLHEEYNLKLCFKILRHTHIKPLNPEPCEAVPMKKCQVCSREVEYSSEE
jgi:hypothetical protein